MPARRRGQMLVAMVLMLGLLVMSFLVTSYQAHALFLRARGIIVREIAAAITADFNRALAAVLAAYSRICYDPNRFPEAALNIPGLSCDTTLAEEAAWNFLNTWSDAVKVAYAEYGVQVKWSKGVVEIGHLLPHQPYFVGVLNISWFRPVAGSFAYARLRLNLTTVGFYNWKSDSLLGLTVRVEEFLTSEDQNEGEKAGGVVKKWKRPPRSQEELIDSIRIRAFVDNCTYYGLLLARGWVEVYAYDDASRSWSKLEIKDMTYEGLGYYTISLKDRFRIGTRIRIVASDERGIIVVAEDVAKGNE